jgi:hypothetical protein
VNALPPGERVVRCLTGGEIDRVPFGVGLGWHPWGSALPNWRRDSGLADLEPAKFFGYDRSFDLPAVQYGIFPVFPHQVLEKTAEYTIYRNERGIVAKQQHDDGSMPDWIEHPVKSPADWEPIRERLQMTDARITEDWPKFCARLKETGEAVQVGTHPWGMFGTVRDFLGNDIRDYRRQYPTLGIMHGLDKRVLAGSLADVDRELDKAREMVKQGRYIPGFDHLIPPDAKWENFQYAATKLKELCYQS